MYGGQCYGTYTQSLLQLQELMIKNNIIANLHVFQLPEIGMQYSCMYNESLIPRARNALTAAFLKSDCTHLFFWDADIKNEDARGIMAMIQADKDIICGIYPKKEINWESVARAVQAGVPVDQLKYHTGSWVVNLVNYTDSVTVPVNEPLEIYNGGTGFMMIKREVFEKLKSHTETYRNDVNDLSGTIPAGEEIYKFFDTPIEPETRRLLSEDYALCHNWRKIGGKVYAAPWINLGHTGTFIFEGRLLGAVAPAAAIPDTSEPASASTGPVAVAAE